MTTSLRLEMFVSDLDRFVDFYVRILGFHVADDRRQSDHPYVAVADGSAIIGASVAWEPVTPGHRQVPSGVEVVLEFDEVAIAAARVEQSGWPISDPLQERPWGLTDFRVHDPDGHYIRLTSRR